MPGAEAVGRGRDAAAQALAHALVALQQRERARLQVLRLRAPTAACACGPVTVQPRMLMKLNTWIHRKVSVHAARLCQDSRCTSGFVSSAWRCCL